jgi:hypothetical protein
MSTRKAPRAGEPPRRLALQTAPVDFNMKLSTRAKKSDLIYSFVLSFLCGLGLNFFELVVTVVCVGVGGGCAVLLNLLIDAD